MFFNKLLMAALGAHWQAVGEVSIQADSKRPNIQRLRKIVGIIQLLRSIERQSASIQLDSSIWLIFWKNGRRRKIAYFDGRLPLVFVHWIW